MSEPESKKDIQNNLSGGQSFPGQKLDASKTKKDEWQLWVENKMKDLNKDQREVNKKIKELNRDKISFITVSGIFVAIFTFISIEIQILRYICDFYKIVGFTFIFAGILILFISLLDYVARSWVGNTMNNQKRVSMVLGVAIILIVLGLFEVGKSNSDWKCKDSENYPIIQFNPEVKPSDIKVNLSDTVKIIVK